MSLGRWGTGSVALAPRAARRQGGPGSGARGLAVGAVCFGAAGVEAERVVGDGKAFGFRDGVLAFFDFGVVKLFYLATI